MELLYTDQDIVVCVKPVGMDSESEVPAALIEQLGGRKNTDVEGLVDMMLKLVRDELMEEGENA